MIQQRNPHFSDTSDIPLNIKPKIISGTLVFTETPSGTERNWSGN